MGKWPVLVTDRRPVASIDMWLAIKIDVIIIPKGLDLRRDYLRSRLFEALFRSLFSSLQFGPLPSPLFHCFPSSFFLFTASFPLLVLLFPSQLLVVCLCCGPVLCAQAQWFVNFGPFLAGV